MTKLCQISNLEKDKVFLTNRLHRALNMAIQSRKYVQGQSQTLIHHSDRGLQYCSNEYQEILDSHHIKCSMTEKYDPYQNAIAERINGILKQEFIGVIGDLEINNLDIMKEFIANSIHIYNTYRPHFSNYYLTPKQMHEQVLLPRRKYVNDKMSINFN